MKRPILSVTLATLLLGAARPALADTIFISNEKDNTVTVVDGKSLEVIKTIPTAAVRAASSPVLTLRRST